MQRNFSLINIQGYRDSKITEKLWNYVSISFSGRIIILN